MLYELTKQSGGRALRGFPARRKLGVKLMVEGDVAQCVVLMCWSGWYIRS